MEFVYSAFWELSPSRNIAWGVGPLSWLVIHEYAVAHRLGELEEQELLQLIRKMDEAFLEYHIEQDKEKRKG